MMLRVLRKGGIMMPTMEPRAPVVDQDVSTVEGGAAYFMDVERRVAPSFERSEPRQRAMAYLRGLLSPAERKNSWQVADVSGDTTPYGVQHLLRRALWDPEAVRDELRHYIMQHLGDAEAVLVIDETGLLKKGRHAAGVARQYSGTAGRLEHCQSGVCLGSASRLGQALLDRELYLPQEWTEDSERCRRAGIPADRRLATKPQLARQMLARARAAGVPAQWVTGDSVDGDDRRLRRWLEEQSQAYGLAVSGTEYIWLDGQQRQVKPILAALPQDGWTRLSAGEGAKGPRWYDWRWLSLADPVDPQGHRWLLVRRRISDPTELRAYVVFAPQETTLEAVGRVAGARWTIKQLFEVAKGEVGLDHDEVRSWTRWYRHITLVMWVLALLAIMRAGTIAVEMFKKTLAGPQERHSLRAFKARRGLQSL
jgi:SRSO17 transposase